MDLRVYFQKLRSIEANIPTSYVVVVSQETPDGGRAGVQTEVRREMAARLVIEGRARLASEEEMGHGGSSPERRKSSKS